MGTKRVGLARTQALIENLKRELSLGGSSIRLGRVHLAKTANYTMTEDDSGVILQVNPAGTTLIQLPGASDVGAGWFCTIIVDESDGGTLDQIVNIGTKSGEFFTGCIWGHDGGGNSLANGTSNDFINLTTDAQSGVRFEIHSDGTRMHATGWAVDATDTKFADTAAS